MANLPKSDKPTTDHLTDFDIPLYNVWKFKEVSVGFYESRLKIETGMWEKGKSVSLFRGVKGETSFRQLEQQTGRKQENLKKWHSLYQKYPDKEKFISELST